jgi:hypothetical protein
MAGSDCGVLGNFGNKQRFAKARFSSKRPFTVHAGCGLRQQFRVGPLEAAAGFSRVRSRGRPWVLTCYSGCSGVQGSSLELQRNPRKTCVAGGDPTSSSDSSESSLTVVAAAGETCVVCYTGLPKVLCRAATCRTVLQHGIAPGTLL